VLESRLSRYETQLADWCHCPSGKTPEGKKKIADLLQKAGATREEIRQIEAARSVRRVAASTAVMAPSASQGYARAPMDSGIDVHA
jgi:hypothetical protein